ncbi:unnamed protein product [Paramecium octaurelia]|uniref:Uncharacterized protein n=1 Tax=Paramecium octaurelia TaxID=43137 RepID=A0A8S1UGL7_PAROT|nr:unnamed protein product [Paramecium octaurelia]
MVHFTISLLNVYKQYILMQRLQVNRPRMFLDILKLKLQKMVKNNLFIQKKMAKEFLTKKHVSQF